MRTREQIEEFKGMPSVPVYSQNWCEALKIELLLDIRELLMNPPSRNGGYSTPVSEEDSVEEGTV